MDMQDGRPAILVKDLTKNFGDFTAVSEINLEIRHGEIFGFLGPNGSGKTTTIRMMLGLMQPSSGVVEVLGIPVAKEPAKIRPRVGYMSQRFSLYNDLTVLQNLKFYGQAYGLKKALLSDRIDGAIDLAGLEGHEDMKTRDLSGGWRQRLALGAAILHRPELLFLDEPTAGVDPISRRAFWDLLYKLVAEGITVFVTTHYMDEAEHCHRLSFIQRSKIIAAGTPQEIKAGMMSGIVLEIASDKPVEAVKVLREAQRSERLPLKQIALYGTLVHAIIQFGGESEIQNHQDDIAAELRKADITLERMEVIQPSLEDVFIDCMQ
jgi:ABC-2 type transport system ATP-binding protein